MKVGTNHVNVQTCTKEKNVGVTFDNLLKFDDHIQNAVSKANMISKATLKRAFTFF